MRNYFDRQLSILNDELTNMGMLIEGAISNAVKSLTERNSDFASAAGEFERQIDQKERDIESLCLKLLLKQQPVAKDLRIISSALKMITDMERIGDQAEDIADISLTMPENLAHEDKLINIPDMAEATIKMVNDCIEAFKNKDVGLAIEVIEYDDVVDEMFERVKNDLISVICRDTKSGEVAIDLIMIAKYLERIGDHATNIAEWVVFSITGEHNYENVD